MITTRPTTQRTHTDKRAKQTVRVHSSGVEIGDDVADPRWRGGIDACDSMDDKEEDLDGAKMGVADGVDTGVGGTRKSPMDRIGDGCGAPAVHRRAAIGRNGGD